MKKRHLFISYLLIGLGVYFLIEQLDIAFFRPLFGWPTILGIVGIAFLLYSYTAKDKEESLIGIILIGLSIHFYGMQNYEFWYNHWSIYSLIIGIAYLIQFIHSKKGLIPGLLLVGLSLLMIFSISLPEVFQPLYWAIDFFESFWPLFLILLGLYFFMKK